MPAENPFTHYTTTTSGPALTLLSISPSDSSDLVKVVRDIRVGSPGDVAVITADGTAVVFANCFAGEHLGPFGVARVKATGTTASSLVGYV